jgi:hypothetical protein
MAPCAARPRREVNPACLLGQEELPHMEVLLNRSFAATEILAGTRMGAGALVTEVQGWPLA